jgi:hypothetical protein
MLPVVSAVARRRTAVMATRQMQRRGMAGHAPKPEWTGINKTVRSYFPEDYQRTSLRKARFQIPSVATCNCETLQNKQAVYLSVT